MVSQRGYQRWKHGACNTAAVELLGVILRADQKKVRTHMLVVLYMVVLLSPGPGISSRASDHGPGTKYPTVQLSLLAIFAHHVPRISRVCRRKGPARQGQQVYRAHRGGTGR